MRVSFYKYYGLLFSVLLAATLVSSCNKNIKKQTDDTAANYIKDYLSNRVEIDSLDAFSVPLAVRATYSGIDHEPLWVTDAPDYKHVEQLLHDIKDVEQDGLSKSYYQYSALSKKLKALKQKQPSAQELAAFDTACTYSYLLLSRDLLLGHISVSAVDTEWYHRNDTLWTASMYLQDSLHDRDRYPSAALYKSKLSAYQLLREERERLAYLKVDKAIELLDTEGGVTLKSKGDDYLEELHPERLGSDGVLRDLLYHYFEVEIHDTADSVYWHDVAVRDSVTKKIDVNLERLRWLPQHLESKFLLVNVPSMQLYLNIDDKDTMHMRVVVGKKSRATPTMSADMVNLVFNPTWTVPPGIMKKDIIPGMNRKGSAYLDKKGLAVYSHTGKMLNPDSIIVTKRNFKNYIFRQPPGSSNALGRVKFNLPNRHNIYLHDTPSRSDFKKKKRAKSSGCIRVQHPRDMAGYILTKVNQEEDSKHFVDSLINKQKMIFVPLLERIPVHILYLTATEDSAKQRVVYYDDIYDKDDDIARLLNVEGT